MVQGCCNHWDCPRCGIEVAKQHYGRIVSGARDLVAAGHKLAFLTVTCRGRELSASEAFDNYLLWTNRLIDAMRAKATRATKQHEPEFWSYVQVTEKQQRSHPHSHFLITFMPDDTCLGFIEKWTKSSSGFVLKYIEALRSDWLVSQVKRSALGEQYDISEVGEVEAASRYVAKYMFKSSQFTSQFPKHWKRVRYAQSWPKLPTRETNAFVLLSLEHWGMLASLAAVVDAQAGEAYDQALRYLQPAGVVVHQNQKPDYSPVIDKLSIID